jgi:hypothetical protein
MQYFWEKIILTYYNTKSKINDFNSYIKHQLVINPLRIVKYVIIYY